MFLGRNNHRSFIKHGGLSIGRFRCKAHWGFWNVHPSGTDAEICLPMPVDILSSMEFLGIHTIVAAEWRDIN
jgi:hypothetical protein